VHCILNWLIAFKTQRTLHFKGREGFLGGSHQMEHHKPFLNGQFAVFHQSAGFVRRFRFTFAALETLLFLQLVVFSLTTTLFTFNPSFQTHCSEVFKALFFGRES
jgi:hypothetical protein